MDEPRDDASGVDSYFGDEGRHDKAAVEARLELPIIYIHNDKDSKGENGGLFIPDSQVPDDAIIDEKYAKRLVIDHLDEDSPGGFKRQEGWILPNYHLTVVAFDHDDRGPVAWTSEQSGKVAFYLIAGIWQFWSPSKPFRIKYSGKSNGYRMCAHVRNFLRYVVGAATAEHKRKNPTAKSLSYNQFLLPVKHRPMLVGKSPDVSWACPVQDLEERGLRTTKDGRTGVSTLKMFADNLDELKKLYIPKKNDGSERIKTIVEWIDTYGGMVKELSSSKAAEAGHFTEDADKLATDAQMERIKELAEKVDQDPDVELAVLRGAGQLKGGTDDSTIFNLTQAGASILIDHLKLEADNLKQQAAPASAAQSRTTRGSESRQPPAPTAAMAATVSAADDEEIPF